MVRKVNYHELSLKMAGSSPDWFPVPDQLSGGWPETWGKNTNSKGVAAGPTLENHVFFLHEKSHEKPWEGCTVYHGIPWYTRHGIPWYTQLRRKKKHSTAVCVSNWCQKPRSLVVPRTAHPGFVWHWDTVAMVTEIHQLASENHSKPVLLLCVSIAIFVWLKVVLCFFLDITIEICDR